MNKLIIFWIQFIVQNLQNLHNVCDQIETNQLLKTLHTLHLAICVLALFPRLFWLNCLRHRSYDLLVVLALWLPLLLKKRKTITTSLPVWLLKNMKAISNATVLFRY